MIEKNIYHGSNMVVQNPTVIFLVRMQKVTQMNVAMSIY